MGSRCFGRSASHNIHHRQRSVLFGHDKWASKIGLIANFHYALEDEYLVWPTLNSSVRWTPHFSKKRIQCAFSATNPFFIGKLGGVTDVALQLRLFQAIFLGGSDADNDDDEGSKKSIIFILFCCLDESSSPGRSLARVLFAQENRRHDRLNPLIIFQVAKMRRRWWCGASAWPTSTLNVCCTQYFSWLPHISLARSLLSYGAKQLPFLMLHYTKPTQTTGWSAATAAASQLHFWNGPHKEYTASKDLIFQLLTECKSKTSQSSPFITFLLYNPDTTQSPSQLACKQKMHWYWIGSLLRLQHHSISFHL